MKKALDEILEKAIEKALGAAAARAEALALEALEPTLKAALEARLRALLEAPAAPETPVAPVRARARAKAAAVAPEAAATPAPEATAAAAKVRRRKAKAEAAANPEAVDMATLMGSVEAALRKYEGLATPKGKPLPQVLTRRVRKVLEHAQGLGRTDLPALARSALAVIASDPRGVAMGSWQALAGRLGLPVPVAQAA